MKRVFALILSLALTLCAVCAWAEEVTFEQLSKLQWSFSSGVGGWSTELQIAPDGSFTGNYHDSEMGENGDTYPNGSIYGCGFSGKMTLLEQVDDLTWKVRVDSLSIEGTLNEESIDDGTRFVTVEPYGISEGDEMVLYLPGTPIDTLSEDMLLWTHVLEMEQKPTQLECWFLSSAKNESGFVGYPNDD